MLAFYAPMKSPNYHIPSGDREMARGIFAALGRNASSWEIELASELRIYDGAGDPDVQGNNYYKAPDLIGPVVSKELNIPYLLIEASIAKKRYQGPWAEFARLADVACLDADAIFYLTERDKDALQQHKPADQALRHLPPFLNVTPDELPPAAELSGFHLLSVGMHRPGDKMESYKSAVSRITYSGGKPSRCAGRGSC